MKTEGASNRQDSRAALGRSQPDLGPGSLMCSMKKCSCLLYVGCNLANNAQESSDFVA